MGDPMKLEVDAGSSKAIYDRGETPEWTCSARTDAGEPVHADLQWGLRVLPDGDWVDYSREYAVSTRAGTGTVTWRWLTDEWGPPAPDVYEMEIVARAYEDDGQQTGEGYADLIFEVKPD